MRNSKGQVALALNIVIAIFVVGSLGMVSYEMSRILLAREQLKNCLELASLAGGTAMASTSATGATARTQSQTIALNILQMNSVLGQSLNSNVVVCGSVAALNPSPGQTAVYFEFDDPVTHQPAPVGQQANVLRVYGAYAYPLFSGGFGSIGVSTYTLLAEASAGMPALDLVIVDNISGSMDDQTKITLVRRHWDQTSNDHIIYSRPGTGPGPDNEGTISAVFCPKPIGSQVNGLPPQNLDAGGDQRTSLCPKEFSEVGPTGKTVPLRGITNNSGPGDAPPATPPEGGVGLTGLRTGPGYTGTTGPNGGGTFGNTVFNPTKSPLEKNTNIAWRSTIKAISEALVPPAYASWTEMGVIDYEAANGYGADNTLYTDMVVNLDGNTHFGGYTDPNLSAYIFPRLDFLVEAARGNMENGNVSPDAWLSNDLNGYCQPGYQQAYEMIAYRNLQPKATIESAICNFMTKVSQTSDCHFGFVAFGDRAGTSANDTFTAPMVSWAYPVAGNVTCLLPQIPIDKQNTNLQQVTALLTPPTTIPTAPTPKMTPNGGCNLADGLKRALEDLTGQNSRSGAMKAIVVITDKVPTRNLAGDQYPDPTGNAPALSDAMDIAARCSSEGIPIFMVTIDQANGQMSSYMRVQYSDTSPDGLVSKAGHGGALYINPFNDPTTGVTGLNGSFNNVVRQLTTLVQTDQPQVNNNGAS